MSTPETRIRPQNDRPVDSRGAYVLYWMTAARRTRFNFSLQRAVEAANALGVPLVILEALGVLYPYASDRLHTFVIEGMRDNAGACGPSNAYYYPYVEPGAHAGRGLVAALAGRAALVVTDWFPVSWLSRVITKAAAHTGVRFEAIDSNGLLPVATHGRAFPTARGYRAFMQRSLRHQLPAFPDEDPLTRLDRGGAILPPGVERLWPRADLTCGPAESLAALPIDHSVPPSSLRGGQESARRRLETFLAVKLAHYAEAANHPDAEGTSHLSPYLHFGHVSAHEVFSALMTHERWTSRKLDRRAAGAREGWWNVSAGAEHFLDQIVVWRELAFNGSAWTPGLQSFATLPRWARETLDAHRGDPRPRLYTLEQLDEGATHDAVWNAAQNELRTTGWCHGYLRMLWGKKILEWSRQPEEALERMAALMDRYALDGRDPVSSLNYAWVLGRYDRPWFERPVFGTVRYMTSESAKRKLKLKNYLATFSAPAPGVRR